MQIEALVSTRRREEAFDQSGAGGSPPWFAAEIAEHSLAVDRDAGLAQCRMIEALDRFCHAWSDSARGAGLDARQFPALVSAECFEASFAEAPDPRRARLRTKLLAAFEEQPVEDGIAHPAEAVIATVLASERSGAVFGWLKELSLDESRPSFAASVLRCLGRQRRPGTTAWRASLIRHALTLDDVEVRDAAVRAAEMWGDRDAIPILREHREVIPWLRDYTREVIQDLER